MTISLVLSALLIGTAAYAQDEAGSAGDAGNTGVTRTTGEEATRGYLKNEVFSVKPQLGVFAFKDAIGQDTARGAAGIGLDWNLTALSGLDQTWYLGPSSGFIFSHFGSPGSNFVGTSSPSGDSGSNVAMIPADVKIGYNFSDSYRLGVHGGGNVIYRSVANAMNLSDEDVGRTDSLWKIYPNIGADFDFALGKNTSLALRPDVTITPGNDFFVGTLALGINIG